MKKKKELTEKQKKKEALEERVKKLRTSIKKKLDAFSKKHVVYLPCWCEGKKVVGDKIKSPFKRQHIYICKEICKNPCSDFLYKTYICKEIGCTNYPVCSTKSIKELKKICKKKGLYKERLSLIKLYKKYFHLMAIYRGLKIDPETTLKYLEQQKKLEIKNKKEDKKDGKIQRSKNRKKSKTVRKVKRKTN